MAATLGWLTVDPDSGSSGVNKPVDVDADEHTGRTQRQRPITLKATGCPDKPCVVTQTAMAEFVEFSGVSVAKGGGTATLTGVSNSAKLSFTLGSGDISVSLPANYLAGGATTANEASIAGDPGATAAYEFSIAFTVPANDTISTKSRTVTVTANGGMSKSASISQAAGDPFIELSQSSITLDADGTPVTIYVTSNTNWYIE